MIKINYKKPEEDESPDDIAMYNMKISDKYKNLQAFCQSTVSWLKNDPSRNYQDLEILLRHMELDTHLIARPKKLLDSNTNFVLTIPNKINDSNVYDYVLWISCKPRLEAINELLSYHTSYEENFECLKNTGCLVNKDKNFDIKKISTVNKDEEKEEESKILACELKYDFIEISQIESLNIIIKDLIEKHGDEPKKMVCGKYGELDVYSLVVDGQIISPIGWIAHSPENIELIDFRTMKKM
jgi:hypothetical protein